MKPTRRSQPFRAGSAARGPGAALTAMLRGATAAGANPANQRRSMQKRGAALSRALKRKTA